ncbi:hypothetical protein, partial [Mycolicibacterium vanbaalenii]|uniref:hypothetical protein n=1 Tax=Mycolicibacterium vanbaalenii TaxID=110539 RepID=UPI0021F30510
PDFHCAARRPGPAPPPRQWSGARPGDPAHRHHHRTVARIAGTRTAGVAYSPAATTHGDRAAAPTT